MQITNQIEERVQVRLVIYVTKLENAHFVSFDCRGRCRHIV